MTSTKKELEYDALTKKAAAQDVTVGNIRNRAVGLLTVSTFLITISATVGLVGKPNDPNPISGTTARILVILLAVMALCVIVMIWPRVWHFGPTRDHFAVGQFVEGEDEVQQGLGRAVGRLDEEIQGNSGTIKWLLRAFVFEVIVFAGQLGVVIWADFT